MHELSLAQGLINQLLDLRQQHNASKVVQVLVEIGKNSGIVVDSFSFGFQSLKLEYDDIMEAELKLVESEGSELVLLRVEME